MARIIHVEDEDEWIQQIRRALADHHVDSARNYPEALALISGGAVYDLALVDLNLEEDDDRLGGEVLDLLKADYPATRRIVVTGRPPAGGMRANILRRYGADEIIIKGTTTLPDLRRVVAAALARGSAWAVGESARDAAAHRTDSGQHLAPEAKRETVMVIYGHDHEANAALYDFLRAIGLVPREWTQLVKDAGMASPYIGQILERAFAAVQAFVVLFTPDEYVIDATGPGGQPRAWRLQARPNVLLEAGMALATHPDRTVLVLLGAQDLPSDISGRHFIRLDGTAQPLHELAQRLHDAGCKIDRTGSHWLNPARFPSRDNVPPKPGTG
jgi:predicted nucleotide-binding protein